ncbi:MAG: VWA domain-containing protein [Acidobacteria bacterium]|nr:VWA domain-containing protein [Acidobacteriota bacterium]
MTRGRAAIRAGLATLALGLTAQSADLAIVSPREDSYVSGEVTLEASLDPALAVTSVVFFADGREVCRLARPPWSCRWHAGDRVVAHHIRVVATLDTGSRLVRTVSTRGLDHAEVVDVDAVQLVAVVTDRRGRFVGGLRRSDFRVYEDGVPQAITTFADESVPVEIVVAVDMSGSMDGVMPEVRDSVGRFLGAVREGDPVTVVAFNETLFLLTRRDADPRQRQRAVDRLSGWGSTALYDAILEGLRLLAQQAGRKALVLFTDGDDVASAATLEDVERQVQQSDAAIYVIGLGRAPQEAQLRQVLERLATASGGRAFFPSDASRLDEAFATVRDDLAAQYYLGYVPMHATRDGRWRTLKVEVAREGVRVRARQGYRLGG